MSEHGFDVVVYGPDNPQEKGGGGEGALIGTSSGNEFVKSTPTGGFLLTTLLG